MENKDWLAGQYRLLLANLTDYAIFILNVEGRIVTWNYGAEVIFGYSENDVLGKSADLIFTPEDLQKHVPEKELAEASVKGRAVDERWHLRKDGSRFRASGVLTGLYDESGALVGFARVVRDVTERKRWEEEKEKAAQALRQSEEHFRVAVEAAGLGTWEHDPSSGETYWTERTKAMFALAPDTPVSCDVFFSIIHPEDRDRVKQAVQRALDPQSGGSYSAEYRIIWPDGSVRWIRSRAQASFHGAGHDRRAVRLIGAAMDITRQKNYEEDLRRANAAKDEFLATLSHELRTPLTSIVGWARLLRNGGLNQERIEHGLEVLERSAQTEARLVEDILDTSSIVFGKLTFEREKVDLQQIVRSAVESMRPTAEAKHLIVESELNAAPLIHGHGERLLQVLANILSNAVKFTPSEGHVRVTLRQVGEQAEIRVSDTGIGIPSDLLPHVFERFRQADTSTTRRHGGLGLGLTLVKHLVELHGGTVTLHSTEGRGTTVIIKLPVVSPSLLPQTQEQQHQAAESGELELLKILVVEDDPDTRELIGAVLQDHGAQVLPAESASNALERYVQDKPDVVLADIGLPDCTGYTLMERVRSLEQPGSHTPAIALTAYASEADRKRAISAGYDVHLAKPFDPDKLIQTISGLIAA